MPTPPTPSKNGKESVPPLGKPDGQMTPLEGQQNQGFSPPEGPGEKVETNEPQKEHIEQHIPNPKKNIDQGGVD